jgi:multicomponent Na+:H+ antiporter subunit F
MNTVFHGAALVLLLVMLAGLLRVMRGPSRADSMLSAQLIGTNGVAVLLLLAQAHGQWALLDAALILALLAAVAAVAFVRLAWRRSNPPAREPAP